MEPTDEATVDMISTEEPAVQQRPLIVVAPGDEEYQQITAELSKHHHADQAQSPLIIIP